MKVSVFPNGRAIGVSRHVPAKTSDIDNFFFALRKAQSAAILEIREEEYSSNLLTIGVIREQVGSTTWQRLSSLIVSCVGHLSQAISFWRPALYIKFT